MDTSNVHSTILISKHNINIIRMNNLIERNCFMHVIQHTHTQNEFKTKRLLCNEQSG